MIPTTKLSPIPTSLTYAIRIARKPEERAFLTALQIDYPELGIIPARGSKKGPDVIGVPMPSACNPADLSGPEILHVICSRVSHPRQVVNILRRLPLIIKFNDDDELELGLLEGATVNENRLRAELEKEVPKLSNTPDQKPREEPTEQPEDGADLNTAQADEQPEDKPDTHVEALLEEEE